MPSIQLHWQRVTDRFRYTVACHDAGGERIDMLYSMDEPVVNPSDGDESNGHRPDGVAARSDLTQESHADRTLLPVNPPLQHVERPQTSLALCVGMAHANHWSLSVTLTDQGADFDVACRVHTKMPLGNVYDSPHLNWTVQKGIAVTRWRDHHLRLVSPSADWEMSSTRLILRVEPVAATLPYTLRWQYRLEHD